MIHHILVLSIITVPATSAELSSLTRLTPTLLTIPSLFSLTSTMHHTPPQVTQNITASNKTSPSLPPAEPDLPFPVDKPSASQCNTSLSFLPFATCLWSTGQLSPLLSLLQKNVSKVQSEPYTHHTCWKWILQTCLWIRKHTFFMKQIWQKQIANTNHTLQNYIKNFQNVLSRHSLDTNLRDIGDLKSHNYQLPVTQNFVGKNKRKTLSQGLTRKKKKQDLFLLPFESISNAATHLPNDTEELQAKSSVNKKLVPQKHLHKEDNHQLLERSSSWVYFRRKYGLQLS